MSTLQSSLQHVSSAIDEHAASIAQHSAFYPVLSVLLFALYLYSTRAQLPRGIKNADPDWSPWFGSLLAVMKRQDDMHDRMVEISRKHNEQTFGWGIPSILPWQKKISAITIAPTEANTEYVLKTNANNYPKGPIFADVLGEFLGTGIFNVDGKQWQWHRKIASHVFTSRNIKEDMTRVFVANADLVEQVLDSHAETHKTFDFQQLMFDYTLESFALLAFGERPNLLTVDRNTPAAQWSKSFDVLQSISSQRFQSATWQLKRMLQIGSEKELTEHVRIIDKYAADVIQRRRAALDGKVVENRPDLLSRFLEWGEEHNEPLQDRELRDIILNFLVAGRDTTAVLLTWATYELTQNPQWADKMLQVVQSAESPDAAAHAPEIQAFLHEVLRLHPSVPGDAKQAINDDRLPDGTFVPAGTVVGYNPYLHGRSKKLWGEDCDTFNPARWLSSTSRTGIIEVSPFKFLSFNAPPRLCLGKSVALTEAGLMFARLINRYEFTVPKGYKPGYIQTITLVVKDGLQVKVARRAQQ